MRFTLEYFCSLIDNTLLSPDTTKDQLIAFLDKSRQYPFAAVCVNSCNVALAHHQLKDTNIKICSVIGFPLGAMSIEAKAFEAKKAVEDGVLEIDMVLNIGRLKDKDNNYIVDEVNAVADVCKNIPLKVIIETCLLTKQEMVYASSILMQTKAAFIKTSTGFSKAGAQAEDVALIKSTVNEKLKIKASGGIKTIQQVKAFIQAGADRIGTSSGFEMAKQLENLLEKD